jgi:hypothetical protein
MKVRALLLEGEFKAELPKYELPEVVTQLWSRYITFWHAIGHECTEWHGKT